MMMARGTLVIDENLFQLIHAIKSMNIHVIIPESGWSDQKIAENLLVNRIFVTRNSKDFIQYAPGLAIIIVGVEGLKFIDTAQETNTTVKIISDAIIKYKLWSRNGGCFLELREDGKHKFQKFY